MFNHKKHLFFDLDHTLWDYESNSEETLTELWQKYDLSGHGVELPRFLSTFTEINEKMWDDFHVGLVDKDTIRKERFPKVFKMALKAREHFEATLIGVQGELAGSVAAMEHRRADEALNYGEIFLRDNVPVMIYLMLEGRFAIVKQFLSVKMHSLFTAHCLLIVLLLQLRVLLQHPIPSLLAKKPLQRLHRHIQPTLRIFKRVPTPAQHNLIHEQITKFRQER